MAAVGCRLSVHGVSDASLFVVELFVVEPFVVEPFVVELFVESLFVVEPDAEEALTRGNG